MRNDIIRITIFIFLFYSSSLFAEKHTEDEKIKKRPKIGLVLSGGGAKGLAHVGVLKVLEELNIYPDYITGVSMGSIVGGLYAIGYSASDLDRLVKSTDWNKVFSDQLNYHQVNYNVKDEYRKYQLQLSGNSFEETSLPIGVVGGQIISELFSELTWRATGIESFDDFPIPFRCTATDLISGTSYLFKSGSLVNAMRASMSIPTAFSPIIMDSMLLVDGGVLNNFPVQECIDMGAEIIIGVYVGSDENVKAIDVKTMVDVLSHSASFMGVVNAKKQMNLLDLKILPKIENYGLESFGKAIELVNIGEQAAREEKVYSKLKALSDTINKYPEKRRVILPLFENELEIGRIQVLGLKQISKDFVIAISELNENSKVNSKQVKAAIQRLYGTLIFEKVEYRFIKKQDKFDLIFLVTEEDRVHLNASVYYDNFFGAGLLLNASYRHFLVNSSKLNFTLDASKYPRARLDFNIMGGKRKRMLYGLGVNLQSIVIPNFYEFDNSLIVTLGEFRNNQMSFFTRVGFSLSTNSKIEFKAAHITNYFQLHGGLEDMYGMKTISSNNFALEGSFKWNTFNHPIFPTRGVRLDILYRNMINQQSSYMDSDDALFGEISSGNEIVVFDYKQFIPLGSMFSIIPEFTLAYMSAIPFYADKFFIGGSGFNTRINTFNQAGIQPYQIATDNFLKFGLGIQLKLNENWYVNAFGESAFFINHSKTYSEESLRLDGETISGWVTSLAYNSVLGPLKFTVSQNNKNHNFYYYFSFGFPL